MWNEVSEAGDAQRRLIGVVVPQLDVVVLRDVADAQRDVVALLPLDALRHVHAFCHLYLSVLPSFTFSSFVFDFSNF